MSYTDAVFKQLISIKSGQYDNQENFDFSIAQFHDDWLKEKSRNWKDVLIQLNNMIDELILEFEEAKKYEFKSIIEYSNQGVVVNSSESTQYPKQTGYFDDFVIHNLNEESIWKKKENHEEFMMSLNDLKRTISDCIGEYEIFKDTAIYNPSYKYYDRIPFNGSERALSAFTNLLIQGGFIISKEEVPENLLPDEGEDRELFKRHVLQKKELSERLSNLFYTVGTSPKVTLNEPNKNNLKSKMQANYMKDLSEKEKKKFVDGFSHIQHQLEKYFQEH